MPTKKPAYLTVVDDIRRQIQTGELTPGAKLPTKREMTEHYKVSGQVIDAAMMVLKLDGTVEGQQGKGIYVAGGDAPPESGPPADT